MSCPCPQIDPVHHIQVLTIIGQVFVSLSLAFLLATIITFVINKYVSTSPFDNSYYCITQPNTDSTVRGAQLCHFYCTRYRSLWNMRNYIHVMLCGNLFAAQLVFVVGVERTENKVLISILVHGKNSVYNFFF